MASTDEPAQPPSSETPVPGVVEAAGGRCRECGYDLRGLPIDGRCPECGTSIRVSLQGPGLIYASPDWLRAVARGMTALQLGIVVLPFAAFAVIMNPIGLFLSFAAATLRCYGVWQATRTDPRYSLTGRQRTGRWVFRVVAAVDLLANAALPLTQGWRGPLTVVHLSLVVIIMVSIINIAFCLRAICRPLIGSRLRRSSAGVAWVLLATFLLWAGPFAARRLIPRGFGGRQVMDGIGLLAVCLFVGCVLLLLADLGALRKFIQRALRTASRSVSPRSPGREAAEAPRQRR